MADSYQMFINGEWVNSSDGGTRDVINPATGGVLASVQEGTAEDANRAVAAAKKAFETWYDSTPKDRQLALLKLADRIEEHGEEIVKLEAENVGKPYAVTMSEELPRSSTTCASSAARRGPRRVARPGSTWPGSPASSGVSRSASRG